MSHTLAHLKEVVDQVATSAEFADQDITVAYHQQSTSERLVISNTNNHADPEVQIDLTNTELILKDGVEL